MEAFSGNCQPLVSEDSLLQVGSFWPNFGKSKLHCGRTKFIGQAAESILDSSKNTGSGPLVGANKVSGFTSGATLRSADERSHCGQVRHEVGIPKNGEF